MARHFTLKQAEALLTDVREAIRRAIELKSEYQEAAEAYSSAATRISMLGGALVDRESILALRSSRDTAAAELQDAIDSIHEYGCLVKDLDVGLIDFPTLYKGEEALLCWKLGEDAIGFWHGVNEGFRGRKPIDQEFLANHEGDRSQ